MKILIADDNYACRLLLVHVINSIGSFDIDQANNGIDTINLMLEKKYDLLLLDSYMPQLDGMDVLRRISVWPDIDNTIVFFITSDISVDTIYSIKREKLKIDGIFVKPLDMEKLKTAFEKALFKYKLNKKCNVSAKQQKIEIQEPSIQVHTIDRGKDVVIQCIGKFTVENKKIINEILRKLELAFAEKIIVDLSKVTEIDAFGYGTLIIANGWLSSFDKKMFVSCKENKKLDDLLISQELYKILNRCQKDINNF